MTRADGGSPREQKESQSDDNGDLDLDQGGGDDVVSDGPHSPTERTQEEKQQQQQHSREEDEKEVNPSDSDSNYNHSASFHRSRAIDLLDELERDAGDHSDHSDHHHHYHRHTTTTMATPPRRNRSNKRITADPHTGIDSGGSGSSGGGGGYGTSTPKRQVVRNPFQRELVRRVEAAAMMQEMDAAAELHTSTSTSTSSTSSTSTAATATEPSRRMSSSISPSSKRRLIRHFTTPSPPSKSPKRSPKKMSPEEVQQWEARKRREVERMRKLFAEVDKVELVDAAEVEHAHSEQYQFL